MRQDSRQEEWLRNYLSFHQSHTNGATIPDDVSDSGAITYLHDFIENKSTEDKWRHCHFFLLKVNKEYYKCPCS